MMRIAIKFVAVILIVGMISCCIASFRTKDQVGAEFGWMFPEMEKYGGKVVCRERDWYVVYQFSQRSFNDFIKNNEYSEKGYQGWKPFKEDRLLGVRKILHINGRKSLVMRNLKSNEDNTNEIAIFADNVKNQIILYYGATYGI